MRLREAVQVLVLAWLAVSLIALTVLYVVHLLEQRRSSEKRPKQGDSKR